jgi:hypothetical protein
MISIVGVTLLALLMKSQGNEKVVIDSLSDNLHSKGILEIGRVSTSGCPSGTRPFFNNIFPGTGERCLCRNNSNGRFSFQSVAKNKRCNVNSYYYKCQVVTLPEKQLEVYRGARLCYKPTEFSYDSYEYSTTSAGCPSGTRACGKDQKGYLCLKNTYPCPVNFIKMVTGNVSNFSGLVPGEKIISLNNNTHLVYSNQNIEGQIVAETNWSFQGMCADPKQKLLTNNSGLSMFLNYKNWVEQCDSIDGVSQDSRWRLLDTYNWLFLLGENASSFKNMEESHILDPKDLSIPYQVYHRGYIHFNKKCKWNKSASTSANLDQLGHSGNSTPVSISGMMIGAIVMFSLAILGSLCYFCVSLNTNEEAGNIGCCACLWVLLLVAACLVGAIFYYTRDSIEINRESSSFNENCMDSLTSKQMNEVQKNKGNMLYYILITLSLSILGLLMLCCALCCTKMSKSKSSKPKAGQYEMHPHGHSQYGYGNNSGNYNYSGKGGKGGKIKFDHSISSHSSSSHDSPRHHNHGGNFYNNPGFNNNPGFYGNNDGFNNPVFDGGNNNHPVFGGGNNNPVFDGGNNNPVFDGGNNPVFDGGNNPVFDGGNNPVFDGGNNNPPPPTNDYGLFGQNGGNDGGFNDFGNNNGGFNDFGNNDNGGGNFVDFGNNNGGNNGGDFFDGGRI